jgi:predicted nucleotidyltransferase
MAQHPKDSSIIDRIVRGLLPYQPERVILFGSVARGDADEYSDIDLIIIKETGQRFIQRSIDVMAYLPRDVSIDVLVYTPQEFQAMQEQGNPFIQEALKDAVLLYEDPSGNR